MIGQVNVALLNPKWRERNSVSPLTIHRVVLNLSLLRIVLARFQYQEVSAGSFLLVAWASSVNSNFVDGNNFAAMALAFLPLQC